MSEIGQRAQAQQMVANIEPGLRKDGFLASGRAGFLQRAAHGQRMLSDDRGHTSRADAKPLLMPDSLEFWGV